MRSIKALCYVVYNNHHVTPIYDALNQSPNFTCQRVSWGRLPEARVKLGWSELDDNSDYMLAWKTVFRHAYLTKFIFQSEIAIIPGPFTAPVLNIVVRLLGKRVYAYSEPFLLHPRTSKSTWSLMLRRIFLKFLDRPKFTLLEMGQGAHRDYRKLGMKRFRAIEFCFSVMPSAGVDSTIFSIERNEREVESQVKLLFVGSIVPRKGLDLLLEALAHDSLREHNWNLSVVGSGLCLDDLRSRCSEYNLEANVRFLGSLPGPVCDQVFAQSDILVVPSRFDGWAAVVNEGMEMGLAIIASDMVGSAKQLIEDGVSGSIFPSEDSKILASGLEELITSPDRLNKMKEQSLIKIKEFRPMPVAQRLAIVIQADLAGTDSGITKGIGHEIYSRSR